MTGRGMLEGSLLVRAFRKTAAAGSRLGRGSVVVRTAAGAARRIGDVASGSAVADVLGREGALSATAGESACFGLLSLLLNRLPKAAGRQAGRLACLREPGIAARALAWLADRLHLWTGLFLCAVLLVPHARWNNLYSTAGVFALFALLLLREASQAQCCIQPRRMGGWFLLYMLFQALAFVSSVYPGLSARFLAFHGTNFLLVLLLVSCFRTLDELVTLVEVAACGLSVSSLYGVWQGIRGVPVKAAEVDTTLNDTGVGRVYGLFDNPNNFAEILILFLPFIAALFFASKGWKRRAFYGLVALPPLVALVMTQSRSSWGGLLVAMCVFAAFLDWRLIPLAGLAGLLVFPFLPLYLRQRVLSIFNAADTSTSYRTKIWNTMLPVIGDYWWTGLGLGNDAVMKITARYPLYTPKVPLHCHNIYLQTWVETGVLGLLALLGFLANTAKNAMRTMRKLGRKNGDPHARLLVMAGLSSMCGILVTSLVEYTWYYPRVMLLFWCGAGRLLAAVSLAGAQGTREDGMPVETACRPDEDVKAGSESGGRA